MRLTLFSDYALRVLLFAEAAGERLVTIDEIAEAYGISRPHVMKVVNALTRSGYLHSVRGRTGGVQLGMPADEINLGDVVRETEPDFVLVECFRTGNRCVISPCCKLQGVLGEALNSFLHVLDQHTLASIALSKKDYRNILAS
jgi:Rrf2 family transcriptional regulator, nitric oxide-sensitive transcriptional repressor